ncbi:MAG: VWA domain-containing protein [Xanthobacteraceae bacterium]|nr:VWA domain-containing protein [Xanthobacteraceae bacterium]PWB65380.1 MAG: pilus assembly protein TadG [Bradyrhizobiaceae bacterium]
MLYTLFARFVSFCRDRRAHVAPLFAISMVPIIGAVGSSVDYSRANAIKSALQSALDSTSLMLSREAQSLAQDAIKTTGETYFRAQFNQLVQPAAEVVSFDAKFTSPVQGSFDLVMTATVSMDLTFMGVVQKIMASTDPSKLQISASSEVKWGMKRLELALVLDNTGSMQQSSKMYHLKNAAKDLLTTLKTAAKKAGDVKVAIIPFDTTVKIGTAYKDEFWIDYTENSLTKTNWEGCVEDRDRSPNSINYDVRDVAPVQGDPATYYPAIQCGSLATAMPLTDVTDGTGWTNLNGKIDEMTPAGYTNTTIGLVWGWHALTANSPFPQGSAPAPDLDKVVVMLTDGQNTRNRWTTSQSSIDARMQLACDNAKAAGIRIYTVRVIDGNASLLRGCASSPSMYYNVQQASELSSVFSSIAQNLANLRISK